jgi:hypothetical protein
MLKRQDLSRGWGLVLAAIAVAGVIAVTVVPRASSSSSSSSSFIQYVQISNTTYSVFDIADVLRLIPQTQIRAAMGLVKACGASGHYGYYSRATGEVGAVAWFPRNPLDCLGGSGVSGGGPGAGGATPCYRAYWTANAFVAFYGNTPRMCARMSTQVPGGTWVGTTHWYTVSSVSVNRVLIKCQRLTTNGRYSVGVFASGKLPGSRNPYWFAPGDLTTGGVALSRVPAC